MPNIDLLAIHRAWLGLVQPVGLVVSPPALAKAQAVPAENVVELQRRLLDVVELPGDDSPDGTRAYAPDFVRLLEHVLGWRRSELTGPGCAGEVPVAFEVTLASYGEILRPSWAARDPENSDHALLLIQSHPRGTKLDDAPADDHGTGWHASPQAKFERLGSKGHDNKYTARNKVTAFQRDSRAHPSPIPIENCPWCGTKFSTESFDLQPNADAPKELRVFCVSRDCEFRARRQPKGLPLQSVDEPIYRRVPAFLIATVDKFANLPWVGESGSLLGRVDRHDADGFYGDADPGVGHPIGGYLPPPALVIQDELHLISGPLGTMVGLYETAIDALCRRDGPEGAAPPKIVASTATVRRAQQQIQALFGRPNVGVFPPPGPDRRDTFFSKARTGPTSGGRLYLGVAAQGRNLKVVLLRTYLALLAAGKRSWNEGVRAKADPNPADPYMTLVGYFNSLRELGGSRRIVEDEVASRLSDYGTRRRRVGEDDTPLFADRKNLIPPSELTSREPTHKVADTKRRLELGYADDARVDVALATNMISVGLDITRLGLMVVTGQPRSASEYIQATSRVGRDRERPGLVVTLLNVHRARDRSHYERFGTWHESFYRAVEATSVTPFSARAIDRGLASVVVALARHGHPALTRARGAEVMLPLVMAWRQGKGSQAQIAAANGMPAPTFAWWCARLGSRRKVSARLVAVDVAPSAPAAGDVFEVELSRGRSVRVPPGFDADALARLLSVLERSC